MEAIFEVIFGVVIELVLEFIGEALVELGFHGTAERLSQRTTSRIATGGLYFAFGAVLGFLSLFVFSKMSFGHPVIPVLYFIVSPILGGIVLSTVSWTINRGINPTKWFSREKFIFGVVFALGYSLARVAFG